MIGVDKTGRMNGAGGRERGQRSKGQRAQRPTAAAGAAARLQLCHARRGPLYGVKYFAVNEALWPPYVLTRDKSIRPRGDKNYIANHELWNLGSSLYFPPTNDSRVSN